MNIQSHVFSECKENIYNEIESKLGIKEEGALDRCAHLLADDPDRQRRREFLLKEREKLGLALQWLNVAGKRDGNGGGDDDDGMDLDNEASVKVFKDDKFFKDDKMNVFL